MKITYFVTLALVLFAPRAFCEWGRYSSYKEEDGTVTHQRCRENSIETTIDTLNAHAAESEPVKVDREKQEIVAYYDKAMTKKKARILYFSSKDKCEISYFTETPESILPPMAQERKPSSETPKGEK